MATRCPRPDLAPFLQNHLRGTVAIDRFAIATTTERIFHLFCADARICSAPPRGALEEALASVIVAVRPEQPGTSPVFDFTLVFGRWQDLEAACIYALAAASARLGAWAPRTRSP